MVRVDLVETFFSPVTRFWELLIGALISQIPSCYIDRSKLLLKKLVKIKAPKSIFLLAKFSYSSYLGLISYPIYLFHWPALVFGKILYGSLTFKIKVALILVVVAAS